MSNIRRLLDSPCTLRWALCLITGCGSVAGLAGIASAQGAPGGATYTWDTVDAAFADYRNIATQKNVKNEVVYGRQGLSANRTALDNWYRKYLFPAMAAHQ